MTISIQETVGRLAVGVPGATRVFEKFGIDYCCGGASTLEEACRRANLEPGQIVHSLQEAEAKADPAAPARAWNQESLTALIDHLTATHHVFTREELTRIDRLLARVRAAHGERHPELAPLQDAFLRLKDDLLPHLLKEEQILFPYIRTLESALAKNSFPLPPPFGTVQSPVRIMRMEHDAAGELLRELRATSREYQVPGDACASYRTLYEALPAFEADLHQHIHLENNLLFPRAVAMEADALRSV